MTQATMADKPLVDQIFERMILSLEQDADFDGNTLESLRGLFTKGELSRPAQISRAIKVSSESSG